MNGVGVSCVGPNCIGQAKQTKLYAKAANRQSTVSHMKMNLAAYNY